MPVMAVGFEVNPRVMSTHSGINGHRLWGQVVIGFLAVNMASEPFTSTSTLANE